METQIEQITTKRREYILHEKLGKGQFGEVWKAENKLDPTEPFFAIKFMAKEKFNLCNKLYELTQTEFRVMNQLKHRNILRAYDFFSDEQNFYMVTSYCSDGDLKSLMNKKKGEGGLEESEAIYYLKQIMIAFECLHSHNIMHRDLKLDNIFLDSVDTVVIGDFGFAKLNSIAYTILGTPTHWAPEIVKTQPKEDKIPYTSKCDLWSIGVCFYEMLFNEQPWKGQAKHFPNLQIQESGANLPFPINKRQSDDCRDLLRRLLTYDVDERISWKEFFSHRLFAKSNENIDPANLNTPFRQNCDTVDLQFNANKEKPLDTVYLEPKLGNIKINQSPVITEKVEKDAKDKSIVQKVNGAELPAKKISESQSTIWGYKNDCFSEVIEDPECFDNLLKQDTHDPSHTKIKKRLEHEYNLIQMLLHNAGRFRDLAKMMQQQPQGINIHCGRCDRYQWGQEAFTPLMFACVLQTKLGHLMSSEIIKGIETNENVLNLPFWSEFVQDEPISIGITLKESKINHKIYTENYWNHIYPKLNNEIVDPKHTQRRDLLSSLMTNPNCKIEDIRKELITELKNLTDLFCDGFMQKPDYCELGKKFLKSLCHLYLFIQNEKELPFVSGTLGTDYYDWPGFDQNIHDNYQFYHEKLSTRFQPRPQVAQKGLKEICELYGFDINQYK